jgi:GNAT superfamily N-acetyltransferase
MGMTGTELSIRPAAVEDTPAVTALTVQLGYAATEGEIRERIVALAGREETQAVFVACLAGEVVGWIDVALTFHLQTPPFALIGGLVVKDGVRGLRIGKRLCDEAEGWSLARGVALVRVTSRSTRADAHRFYLRNGYRDVKLSRVFEKVLG